MGMGSVALGTCGGRASIASAAASCLPRLHADPAVSENKWFLWGLVASGQQHLVRLGECFPVSAGAGAGGGGRARYSGRCLGE